MRLRVGTSGYNFPEWKGPFYPEKLPAAKMLGFYAERLETVEINYTFYRMPNAKTISGWSDATPPGFTFVLKISQKITHFKRLQEIESELRYFCDTALGLGPKLGPLLFQLPPNFKKDAERLDQTLRLVPPEIRCAWEFRHPSWFDEEVYQILRARNAALCVADTEAGTTPQVATANFGYLRLRDEGYGGEDLKRWVTTVKELGAGWNDAFLFFKHEEAGQGPAFAKEFAALFAS
jgi:uncharacterized protein YecE (DUF72 family)